MPFNWFRRKRELAPGEAAAPQQHVHVTPTAPAVPARETTDPTDPTAAQRPKRRRGSRGGKGRKKPTTAAGAATADAAEKPAAKSERKPPERKEKKEEVRSQRRERRAQQPRRRPPQKRPPLPAAKRELLVSIDAGEQRVAILEDDRVAEVYLERPERRSIAGNIYLGVVDNVLPGMEAAFVEIGLEKNGFLYVDEIVVPELEGKRHGRKIQDLIKRGEQVLVQAVKDPMKSKGARLTTEISLPGRFVVYVPFGEGLGVSRRLEDDERARLKDIVKNLKVKEGGVIVRTAAEGASAEDVERDLVFLQKLWKSIQAQAKDSKPPSLIYQESELPLRVTRDLFTGDFERALVDDDTAYKRVVGYLKKTSPHMVEKVERYREKTPRLFEKFGVDEEIRSTLSRRVDLPSGGYLIFDYAEAFTVIDVNTGRFVGGRGRNSNARLEDTITKNNLEAVKEVVRQLRLRDIGGIIVIDFIDMANPANRQTVQDALQAELERDRTKTYVVEISPLGLVEMTRQNVTDGPREILTKKCPTCGGDGVVVSEATAALDLERKLRELAAAKPRTKAFRVEVSAGPGSILIGPGASRLAAIEDSTKRRFFVELREGLHTDHFAVLDEGTIAKLTPEAPVAEGAELELKLGELGRYDANAGVGKLDGLAVVVADGSKLVGKKVSVRVNRVLDGAAYASLVDTPEPEQPITAEREAEKPTRASRAKPAEAKPAEAEAADVEDDEAEAEADGPEAVAEPKPAARKPRQRAKPKPAPAAAAPAEAVAADEADGEEEADEDDEAAVADGDGTAPKKRTRRGSRGGKRRRKKPATAESNGEPPEAVEGPRIHVPDRSLDEGEAGEPAAPAAEPVADAVSEASTNGAAADGDAPPKKKTRRGSRGGRRRRKPAGAAAATGGAAEPAEPAGPEE